MNPNNVNFSSFQPNTSYPNLQIIENAINGTLVKYRNQIESPNSTHTYNDYYNMIYNDVVISENSNSSNITRDNGLRNSLSYVDFQQLKTEIKHGLLNYYKLSKYTLNKKRFPGPGEVSFEFDDNLSGLLDELIFNSTRPYADEEILFCLDKYITHNPNLIPYITSKIATAEKIKNDIDCGNIDVHIVGNDNLLYQQRADQIMNNLIQNSMHY